MFCSTAAVESEISACWHIVMWKPLWLYTYTNWCLFLSNCFPTAVLSLFVVDIASWPSNIVLFCRLDEKSQSPSFQSQISVHNERRNRGVEKNVYIKNIFRTGCFICLNVLHLKEMKKMKTLSWILSVFRWIYLSYILQNI